MAKRRGRRVGIAVPAALAGVRRIAILRAGRGRHNGTVVMAEGRRCLGVAVTAAGAGIGRLAGLGAGRRADGCRIVVAGRGQHLGITVAAARAGIARRAIFRAAGGGDLCRVVVAEGRGLVRSVAFTAARAGIGRIAAAPAGGCGHNRVIIMAEGGNGLGVAVTACGTGVGDAARFGAGRSRLGGHLIVVDVILLDVDDIARAADDIVRRTRAGAGKGQLGRGGRAGRHSAGGRGAREVRAVIAAPGDLRQLPPVIARRRQNNLNIAEALNRIGHGVGGRDGSGAAARIGADGRPVRAVGGDLYVRVRAVVAVRGGGNLHRIEAHLRAEIHAGIHAARLAAGRPVVGGGIAVDELIGRAVIAAVRIPADRRGSARCVGDGGARPGDGAEVRGGDGGIARLRDRLLAVKRIDPGRLTDLQADILARKQLAVALAAAGAGVDRVAVVIRGGIVVAERGDRLGVALAAVGAGIGDAARLRAGRGLRGGLLIVVHLRGGIGVDAAIGVEAAGDNGGIQPGGVAAVHRKAHCAQRQADLRRLLRLRLCAGVVAPHAEHAADDRGRAQRRAADLIVVPVGCIGIAAVEVVILAEDIVKVAGGVDDAEAVAREVRRRARRIAAPAARPVAHDDVLIKGIGRGTDGGARPVGKLDAVVEGDGRHARALHHRGELVDVLDEVAVFAAALQAAKAHGAAGIAVIGVLIGAEVEIFAALGGEVVDVLLNERLREGDRRAVCHVDRPRRAVIAAGRPGERRGRLQNGVHVAGAVEQRDDLDPGGIGGGEDFVHLALRPLAARGGGIGGVARVYRRGDIRRRVGGAVHRDGHIIEQKAHAVVSDGEHDVRIAVRLRLIDERFDPVGGEILSSAVEHGDLHIIAAAGRERRRREHAQQHADREQNRA